MSPKVRKKKYRIELSAVAYLDLLGYGSMLEKVGFNPSHKDSQKAVARMEKFQQKAAEFTMRYLKALILNDGVIYSRELSRRSNSVTYDFLIRVYKAFQTINEFDQKNGYPGVRGIVAVGPRLRVEGVFRYQRGYLKNILRRRLEGIISTDEAIHEAFNSLPLTSSSTELQANFAFTKAYLADQAGSKKGLAGANFFIDATIFNEEIPQWVIIKDRITWSDCGMTFDFLHVESLDINKGDALHERDTLDAMGIFKKLGIQY